MTVRAPSGEPATMCKGVEPMGRGRAKAKQTKVARELKYREFNTDFDQLQRELHGDDRLSSADGSDPTTGESEEADDPYVDRRDDPSKGSANRR